MVGVVSRTGALNTAPCAAVRMPPAGPPWITKAPSTMPPELTLMVPLKSCVLLAWAPEPTIRPPMMLVVVPETIVFNAVAPAADSHSVPNTVEDLVTPPE